jgi:hypothetical protein
VRRDSTCRWSCSKPSLPRPIQLSQSLQKPLKRNLTIHSLRTALRGNHCESSRLVRQAYSRFLLVLSLAAWARGPVGLHNHLFPKALRIHGYVFSSAGLIRISASACSHDLILVTCAKSKASRPGSRKPPCLSQEPLSSILEELTKAFNSR